MRALVRPLLGLALALPTVATAQDIETRTVDLDDQDKPL